MDREAIKRELTEQFQQSLDQAMDAVAHAPDGAWIAVSEWEVRDVFQKLTAQAGQPKIPGKQNDEYPPAMFKEGGAGASVAPVNPSQNMGAGASMGNALRPYPDGTKVNMKVGP